MRNLILIFTSLTVLSIGPAWSHEGHDKTPGSVAAPHGGVIQGTNSLYWELVNDAGGVKLYPLTHEVKPIAPAEITLSGSVNFPKKAKAEAVKFSTDVDAFSAKIDAKGAYHYTLNLSFTYKAKKETVKFQVEPQT